MISIIIQIQKWSFKMSIMLLLIPGINGLSLFVVLVGAINLFADYLFRS